MLLLLLSRFSHAQLCVTPWTVAHQAPLSMGVSRQEYYRGLPCLPPRDLPDPGIGHRSPAWQADSLPLNHQGSPNQERLPHAAKWRNWGGKNITALCWEPPSQDTSLLLLCCAFFHLFSSPSFSPLTPWLASSFSSFRSQLSRQLL